MTGSARSSFDGADPLTSGQPKSTVAGGSDGRTSQDARQHDIDMEQEMELSQSPMPSPSGSASDDSLLLYSAHSQSDSEVDEYEQRSKAGRTYDRLAPLAGDSDGVEGEDGDGSLSDLDGDTLPTAASTAPTTPNTRKKQRQRRRRVYGGGRRASLANLSGPDHFHASRGILSTSFHLSLSCLSPCSALLLPYAYSLTGLSFGLPITFLLLLLGQWFSPSLLVVEGRYTGARSYHALGGVVFPQARGGKHAGQMLVLAFQTFVDGGRTLVALVLASQLLVDLSLAAFPRAPRVLHSHVTYTLAVGLPALLSSSIALTPTRRPILPTRWTRIFRALAQYSLPLLWAIIILVFGVSLKNLDDYPSLTKPQHGHLKLEKPSYSTAPLRTPTLWTGVSILFLLLGSNVSATFPAYRKLRKRNALPQSSNSAAKTGAAALGLNNGSGGRETGGLNSYEEESSNGPSGTGDANAGSGTGSASLFGLSRHVQSHRFESAALLSCALSGLVFLPFGSIGYASLLQIRPNVFETLPRSHGGFNACRVLLAIAICANLRMTGEPAEQAGGKVLGMLLAVIIGKKGNNSNAKTSPNVGTGGKRHKRRNSALELGERQGRRSDSLDGARSLVPSDESDLEADDLEGYGHSYASNVGPKRRRKAYLALVANIGVWSAVIAVAVSVNDLAGIAEVLGCIGCAGLAFLIPSIFHIILFHLRRPRTIVLTSSSSMALQTDALLLRKEKQLQKRLMGKRLGMDIAAFGILLPVGVIGLARGVWAIAAG